MRTYGQIPVGSWQGMKTLTPPKAMLFDAVGYKPSEKCPQVALFHDSNARMRIISAPARTSKSYSGGFEGWSHIYPTYVFVPEKGLSAGRPFPMRPPHGNDKRIWIVAPDYKTAKEWDYLWRLITYTGRQKVPLWPYAIKQKANSPQQGNMRLVLEWGVDLSGETVRTIIETKSATNPESLQGEEIDLVIFSEAGELSAMIWERYMATRCKLAIMPTTPKLSAEWIKNLIDMSELDEDLGIEHFQFSGHANPQYDWERFEIEKKKAASRTQTGDAEDDPWFAEQFLGRWTMNEEQALPFIPAATRVHPGHVLDDRPAWLVTSRHFISCDYGYDDPAVALFHAIRSDGQICVQAEVHERKLTSTEFVAKIKKKAQELQIHVEYVVGDPKKPEVAKSLRELGLPVWERADKNAIADRASGFLNIVDRLALGDSGDPGLVFLSEKCGPPYGVPNTIREIKLLRRKRDWQGDQWGNGAFKGRDDAVDALRYGLQSKPRPHGLGKDDRSTEFYQAQRRARQEAARRAPVHRAMIGNASHLNLVAL